MQNHPITTFTLMLAVSTMGVCIFPVNI